jgi:recombination associated protein RdgC
VARRDEARAEAAFLRGDAGVDGVATEADDRDAAELERDKAREELLRGRTWLGRELLTWLLWRSESGDPLVEVEGAGLAVLFTGRITLRGLAGDVTELTARGVEAPYAAEVRRALDAGLLVHQARLRFTHGAGDDEKVYEATLDAEHLAVRAAKLPELVAEEDDDRVLERLFLAGQLSRFVDALVAAFLEERAAPAWAKRTVPALKRWMAAP